VSKSKQQPGKKIASRMQGARAVWVARWIEQLMQDTRYALRAMRRDGVLTPEQLEAAKAAPLRFAAAAVAAVGG